MNLKNVLNFLGGTDEAPQVTISPEVEAPIDLSRRSALKTLAIAAVELVIPSPASAESDKNLLKEIYDGRLQSKRMLMDQMEQAYSDNDYASAYKYLVDAAEQDLSALEFLLNLDSDNSIQAVAGSYTYSRNLLKITIERIKEDPVKHQKELLEISFPKALENFETMKAAYEANQKEENGGIQ